MFVLGNLLSALAQVLQTVFTLYTWILIARVLMSWVSPDPFNPIVQFLVKATDPVLEPLHRIIPPIGFLDISPVVALLALQGLNYFLVRTLLDLSARLR
ncbi:MAG: YggT family protein [Candidatus Omnitrophica bacterium]|nr:YggT family protein [Candidatus Omnitrophota bacterium]